SFSEIEAAQITKEKIIYYGSRENSKTSEYMTYLELLIRTESLKLLQERLKYERSVKIYKDSGKYKSGTKTHHYPVSVQEGKIIRIYWRGSGSFLTPGVKKAVDLLARNNVTIKAQRRKVRDFTTKAVEDGAKAEDLILEFAERGNCFAAMRLAEQVYDYDTTEAKKFIDSLLE
ncbi:MAG: hypothetical protein JW715_11505, partial [Sedimentisphaerales bacterium]|nr:hypothetical protein [Sedimentisphaerales bacterium]